ncbi:MAG: AEC family transporter [Clostridia bacterium]|nr:AEC family transporter [Clostridia bacterium]
MTITLLLIKKIVSLFIIMMLGVLVVKLGFLKTEDSRTLSVLMLYVVVPCTILNSFQVDYTPTVLKGLGIAAAAALVIHFLWLFLTNLLGQIFRMDVVEKCSIMYTNAGNLIIPLVTSVLGEHMVIYSVAFMAVQLFFMWTHLKSSMSGESGFDWKKIVTNVNLICIVIGVILFLTQFKFPSLVQDTLSSVSAMIGPSAMFVIGMLIGGMNLKQVFTYRRVWLVTFFRLLVFPLIILGLLKVFPIWTLVHNGKNILLVTFLACMTPAASTVTQMAQIFGNDEKYASAINVVTTLLCLVTMPIMVMLYQL